MRKHFALAGLIYLTVVSGCTEKGTTTQVIPTATSIPVSTMAAPPTATVTITATPTILIPTLSTNTAMPPGTFLSDGLMNRNFILGDGTQDCHLPCWMGAKPGVSGGEYIKKMYKNVFNYNNSYDIFDTAQTTDIPNVSMISASAESASEGTLDISAWYDAKTFVLQATQISWESSTISSRITPQSVLFMGDPTEVNVALYPSPDQDDAANLEIVILNWEGVMYRFSYPVTLASNTADGKLKLEKQFCLNTPTIDKNGSVTLMEPLPDNPDNWTPVQTRMIPTETSGAPYLSFETVFEVSVRSVVKRIQNGEDVCLDGGVMFP